MMIKFTHFRKWRLQNAVERSPDEFTAEPCDRRRGARANPMRGFPGVSPRHGIITSGPRDSRAVVNPVVRFPGSFAKKAKDL